MPIRPTAASLSETLDRLHAAGSEPILLSAQTGAGMDSLADAVAGRFLDGSLDLREDAIVTGARQYAALLRAADAADIALRGLREGLSEDLCCVDLELALVALDEIDGRAVSEEIVGEIFAKFCVGK